MSGVAIPDKIMKVKIRQHVNIKTKKNSLGCLPVFVVYATVIYVGFHEILFFLDHHHRACLVMEEFLCLVNCEHPPIGLIYVPCGFDVFLGTQYCP